VTSGLKWVMLFPFRSRSNDERAEDAVELEPDDPATLLRFAGHALASFGNHDRGLALLEKAAGLNVNGSQALNSLGWVKNYGCVGPDQAIRAFRAYDK
jgi:hypothetical protein